jgi:lipoprotein NlpD
MLVSRSLGAWGTAVLAGVILAGCAAQANRAPVEDRGQSASSSSTVDVKSLPGAENAGKPGYYTIKPGDTLIRIGLEHGQSWKDIARWSNLDNPNVIEVGQVVRVVPPGREAPVASSGSGRGVAPVVVGGGSTATTTTRDAPGCNRNASAIHACNSPAPVAKGADDVNFIWPASGSLIAGFDEQRNKGYDISGKAGDPVLAAADGRVVYAGAGLRGYGNLIILKHNNTYLTAYAHNQSLLVKEDQAVKKGQKIAEMGSTDADRVKLHFEVRRQGKPVDPSRYLPSR